MERTVLCVAVCAAAIAMTSSAPGQEEPRAPKDESFFEVRGGLGNCRVRFEKEKRGRIVYMGGSITTMAGWRAMTYDLFRERFSDTEFDFIDAGIGGTNSTLGAFRFEEDVFTNGPVDLLFLEFAVNDGDNDSISNRRARAMEGIIRHARRLNPNIDIVVQYLADTGKVETIRNGGTPDVAACHDAVARHYNLPTINQAQEITRRLDAGEFAWEDFSRDSCHPKEFGHKVYIQGINAFLDRAWAKPLPPDAAAAAYPMPAPLDEDNYENGRFIDLGEAELVQGWQREPAWKASKTCNYSGAVDVLAAAEPGATLRLPFTGRLIGYYGIAGMDAGVVEYRVDGGEFEKRDLFDHYCPRFHRPVCHVLAEGLEPGAHVLELRMSAQKNEESEGHACRILRFVAN